MINDLCKRLVSSPVPATPMAKGVTSPGKVAPAPAPGDAAAGGKATDDDDAKVSVKLESRFKTEEAEDTPEKAKLNVDESMLAAPVRT